MKICTTSTPNEVRIKEMQKTDKNTKGELSSCARISYTRVSGYNNYKRTEFGMILNILNLLFYMSSNQM